MYCVSTKYVRIASILPPKRTKSWETGTLVLYSKGDSHFQKFIEGFPFLVGCDLLWQHTKTLEKDG